MKKQILIRLAMVFFGLFFVTVGGFAMGLGDVGKVCLFSAISGAITFDGKPVANVRLVRKGDRDGPRIDETVTDANGYFKFPAMFERTITKFLPQEFAASQKIIAYYQGNEYEMWSAIKRDRAENSEARGNPLVVSCELNSEQNSIIVGGAPIHSLCVWDVESDPKIDWENEGFFDKK